MIDNELKILSSIYKNDLKITIEPFHSNVAPSVIYRIDSKVNNLHMKYELPCQEWQASVVQEPYIVSMVLARMVDEFNRKIGEQE